MADMKSDVIVHYGIKGMKWGIRRTDAQLARARGQSSPDDSSIKAQRKTDLKNRRTLSTDDIKKRVERLKLEREFKQLTQEDIEPGRKMVNDILKSAGNKVVAGAVAGTAAYAVKVAMTKQFDIKEAASYIVPNPNKKK